jgi:CRISPR/Cas system-associated exonuclease Cas4 (RecB family)
VQLLPVTTDDERAGLPSSSEFSRLLKCRASFLLTKKAYELGQVAHERSAAADLGTKKHLANVEGPEILLPRERESWELCRAKRAAFVKSWIGDSDSPVQSIQEERLWLRKGIRPLLSGKPDEVLHQGARACVIDHKFGSYRVEDPVDNQQLAIYALLVSRDDEAIEEVTAQILSPYFDFEPVVYGREELDRLYRSVLVVVASLDDPGDAVPGDHCHFCPARLICSAAKNEALDAALAKVIELPLGEGAAELLEQIKRAQSLFKEVESHYKYLLEETPGAIPGWTLKPGALRRSLGDPQAVWERVQNTLSTKQFLSAVKVEVGKLQDIWALASGIPQTQAKELFNRELGELVIELESAPSLVRTKP